VDNRKPNAPGQGGRGEVVAAIAAFLDALRREVRVVVYDQDRELASWPLAPPAADGPQPTHEAGPELPQPTTPSQPTPRKKPHPCRKLIVEILADRHPRRMTRPEIMDEVEARGGEWSDKTVQRQLEDLAAAGRVDNGKDENGQGYGFCP
jgi:hypothetical protein